MGPVLGLLRGTAAAVTLQVPNSTTSEFVTHLQFVQHRAWSHTGLGSCMAVRTKLTNLLYYFQTRILPHFLEYLFNRPINA